MSVDHCECCGKEFGSPVKLTVLSEGPEETYFACPFCFSKVEDVEAEAAVKPRLDRKLEKTPKKSEVEADRTNAEVAGCGHHLGHLRGRVKSAAIPDECLVCPKILECMS